MADHLDTDEQLAQSKALSLADKLINLTNTPIDFNGKTLHVGASVGICLLGLEHLAADAAISTTDVAMYRAKKIGRGCAIFFD